MDAPHGKQRRREVHRVRGRSGKPRTLETRAIAGTERYYGVAVRSPLAAMREPAGVDICRTLIEQLLVAA